MRIDPNTPSADPPREVEQELRQLSQQFESMLMSEILSSLSDTMSGEEGEDSFGGALSGVLWLEMTQQLTAERGLGLADAIYRQLSRDRLEGGALGSSLPSLPAPSSPPPSSPLSIEAMESSAPLRPVAGPVTSRFGLRNDPYDQSRRFHGGLDVAAVEGAPVSVTESGRVVFAGNRGDYGNVVIVEHEGGVRTLYAHLSRIDVEPGDALRRGARLGAVGSTGRATGAHLHFEVADGDTKLDPEAWLAPRNPAVSGD